MFKRLKNLYKLSGADVVEATDGGIVIQRKPEKRPATIIEDSPMDQFPTEEPEKI